MEIKPDDKVNSAEDRVQNLLRTLSKLKNNYINEKEEFKKLREINDKLEVQLKETRELEKSHRYHLLKSREMIGNLQETVSQLLYLKREVMKLKNEIAVKDAAVAAAEKDKEYLNQKNKEILTEVKTAHETKINELTAANERKIKQIQHDADTQVAQFTCVIEELQIKIKEMAESSKEKGRKARVLKSCLKARNKASHEICRDDLNARYLSVSQKRLLYGINGNRGSKRNRIKFKKHNINRVVLEYEEKIQRHEAQHSQLQDEISKRAARAEANFEAYRRRMEELEEQLKQSKFRQSLAKKSYMSQYTNQADNSLADVKLKLKQSESSSSTMNAVHGSASTGLSKTQSHHSMTSFGSHQCLPPNQLITNLQMTEQCDEKAPFNITKKRRLYSDKDFKDF